MVGGGIGGLASAIALREGGIEAQVFERRAGLEDIEFGAGLGVWTHGMRALRQLGLADQVEGIGIARERLQQLNADGTILADWTVVGHSRPIVAPPGNESRANVVAGR